MKCNFSEENTRELAISLSPEGEKALQAQAVALMDSKGFDAYCNVKAYLDKPDNMEIRDGNSFRFWDFRNVKVGDESDLILVSMAALVHLPVTSFRWLRILDGYDVEDYGSHSEFPNHFNLIYVPLIAV